MPPPESLRELLQESYAPDTLAAVVHRLREERTLAITPLASGLFSAAVTTDYSAGTNYHAVWVRDNVHVAWAHHVNGQTPTAVAAVKELAKVFAAQAARFDAIIADPSVKDTDVMLRPHVRFNGDDGSLLPQQWSHAQNDALGAFLWIYAGLAVARAIPDVEWDIETIGRFVNYLGAIRYWEDEDSGHWEEARKVSASSIGVVVAGLRSLRDWAATAGERLRAAAGFGDSLNTLIANGEAALLRILPAECVQPDLRKARQYDAALLFLIYPFNAVNDAMADAIVQRTREHLTGPIGIRRYPGDSFYCTDYERKMAALGDDPTRDYSDDIASRNALLGPGDHEAEWCLFDPIISIWHARRYLQSGRAADLAGQTEHLNRALRQITDANPPRCQAYQCAELYYQEGGRTQTSKSVPLLWSQANVWTALEYMRMSIDRT
ncbi:MAG: glycoside hydrolase family 15 protein [bacterium]